LSLLSASQFEFRPERILLHPEKHKRQSPKITYTQYDDTRNTLLQFQCQRDGIFPHIFFDFLTTNQPDDLASDFLTEELISEKEKSLAAERPQ
jgi:hypothetical protein